MYFYRYTYLRVYVRPSRSLKSKKKKKKKKKKNIAVKTTLRMLSGCWTHDREVYVRRCLSWWPINKKNPHSLNCTIKVCPAEDICWRSLVVSPEHSDLFLCWRDAVRKLPAGCTRPDAGTSWRSEKRVRDFGVGSSVDIIIQKVRKHRLHRLHGV